LCYSVYLFALPAVLGASEQQRNNSKKNKCSFPKGAEYPEPHMLRWRSLLSCM
jgi:hypothetical protein